MRTMVLALIVGLCAVTTVCYGQAEQAPVVVAGGEIEIGRLVGRQSIVQSLVISADGRIAASGSRDNLICIWDVARIKNLHVLKAHRQPPDYLAMTPDGTRLASGAHDGILCVWETRTGKLLSQTRLGNFIYGVAISDDGRTAAAGTGDGRIQIVDVATDRVKQTIRRPEYHMAALALNPDGTRVAASERKRDMMGGGYLVGTGIVTVFKTADGSVEKTLEWIDRGCYLRFVDEGRQLQWVNDTRGYGALDTTTWEDRVRTRLENQILTPPGLPEDTSFIIVASAGDVRHIMPGDRVDMARQLPAHPGQGNNDAVAISADGRIALVGGKGAMLTGSEGQQQRSNGSVIILDLTVVPPAKRHDADEIVVNASGTVYTLFKRQAIRFYNVAADESMGVLLTNRGAHTRAQATSDGEWYIQHSGHRLRVEPLVDRDARQGLNFPLRYLRDVKLAVSPDDRWVVLGRGIGNTYNVRVDAESIQKDVQVIDLKTRQRAEDLATGPTPLTGIGFSPDGKLAILAFSSLDDQPKLEQSLQVWDLDNARQVHKIQLDGRYDLPRMSARGVIGAVKDRGIHRWSAHTGEALAAIQLNDKVLDFCFSPDGTRILVAQPGGYVKYLDAESGVVIVTHRLADVKTANVQFLPDGSAIAAVLHHNGSASVYPLELPE